MNATRRDFLKGTVSAAPLLLLPKRSLGASKGRFSLYHTNDTHSRIEPFERGPYAGLGGVARRAAFLRQAREKETPHLVVDGGDLFQGTPWFNKFQGELDMKMLHLLGYDAMVLGNHEFDSGIEQLRKAMNQAPQLQVLSANYDATRTPLADRLKGHHVFHKGPFKVGVFGLSIALEGLVNQKMCQGVVYTDPREAARASVQELREQGCDLVIALSHLGHEGYQGEVGDVDWPKDVAGVDYVVGGHTHTFLEKPLMVPARGSEWETPVLQVGHSGLWVGEANFEVSARRATLRQGGNRLV